MSEANTIIHLRRVMRELIRQAVWPQGVLAALGLIASVASVIALIEYGFAVGLAPTLLLLVRYYEWFLGIVLGWATPCIELLTYMLLGWRIVLYPHWKHIFVLLGLYFFRGAQVEFAVGLRISAVFRFLMGLSLALISSTIAGSIPLVQTDTLSNLLIAAVPVTATFINDITLRAWRSPFLRQHSASLFNKPVPSWWMHFQDALPGIVGRTLVCYLVISIGLATSFVQDLASPGLALLGMAVIIHALNVLVLGAREANALRRKGETWYIGFLRSKATMIGIGMFRVVFWVCVFLILNAGLSLYNPIKVW